MVQALGALEEFLDAVPPPPRPPGPLPAAWEHHAPAVPPPPPPPAAAAETAAGSKKTGGGAGVQPLEQADGLPPPERGGVGRARPARHELAAAEVALAAEGAGDAASARAVVDLLLQVPRVADNLTTGLACTPYDRPLERGCGAD